MSQHIIFTKLLNPCRNCRIIPSLKAAHESGLLGKVICLQCNNQTCEDISPLALIQLWNDNNDTT